MRRCFLQPGIVILMMCVLFAGCKKADSAATATDPQLTFALVPDNPQVTFSATQTSGGLTTFTTTSKQAFAWHAGTANITRFRLNAKRGGMVSEYVSGALNGVNLFSLHTLLSTITIPKGDYTEARATVVFTQTNAAPYPLTLLGTYTTGAGTAIPVEFDMNDNMEISVTVSNIIADGTKNFTANIAMHLSAFLNSVSAQEIDMATRTNGTILINNKVVNNIALYNKIKANMLICSGATLVNKPK